MIAASIDGVGSARIRIRGTDGVGKSAFDASVRPMPFPTAIERGNPPVGPLPVNNEETR